MVAEVVVEAAKAWFCATAETKNATTATTARLRASNDVMCDIPSCAGSVCQRRRGVCLHGAIAHYVVCCSLKGGRELCVCVVSNVFYIEAQASENIGNKNIDEEKKLYDIYRKIF